MQAIWNGAVLASSERTVVVEGNHYFPVEDVSSGYLHPSDTHSVCPWKGTASYYSLVVDGAENPDAAWFYPRTVRCSCGNHRSGRLLKGVQVVESPTA